MKELVYVDSLNILMLRVRLFTFFDQSKNRLMVCCVCGWMEIKTWFKGQLLAVQNKFLPNRKNSVDLSCNWTYDVTTE